MDLLLAQALAAGLEREGRSAARPPPENFFRLPSDPDAWRKLKEACKEENMVVVIEITDNVNDNCRQLQAIFMDIAREIDNIPFLRVQVGNGGTYDEVCVCLRSLYIYTVLEHGVSADMFYIACPIAFSFARTWGAFSTLRRSWLSSLVTAARTGQSTKARWRSERVYGGEPLVLYALFLSLCSFFLFFFLFSTVVSSR